MEEYDLSLKRIRTKHLSPGAAKAKCLDRIRKCEQKYGMTSEEMEKLFSTGDDQWDTVEILKWMSAYHAYHSLLRAETPTDGTVGTTTGASTTVD